MRETDNAPQDHEARPLPTEIICHNCTAENDPFDHLCRKCGTPLTAHAEMDFVLRIRSFGNTIGKATDRPTRGIIVAGLWLIFGPQIPLLVWALLVLSRGPAGEILKLLLVLGMLVLYVAILAKATTRYFRQVKQTTSGEDDSEVEADRAAQGGLGVGDDDDRYEEPETDRDVGEYGPQSDNAPDEPKVVTRPRVIVVCLWVVMMSLALLALGDALPWSVRGADDHRPSEGTEGDIYAFVFLAVCLAVLVWPISLLLRSLSTSSRDGDEADGSERMEERELGDSDD